jgi:STELLO glycosyltransferases
MNKVIVITSIFRPTEAVVLFSRIPGYRVIVVGDRKTPAKWVCDNVDYISVARQGMLKYALAKVLPFDHYCRKMIGYLRAMEGGADCIIDADDDNIPKATWKFPDFENRYDCIPDGKGFVNIYQMFTKQKIWARGLPLNLVSMHFGLEKMLEPRDCKIGIWQGLADGEPDVDAIYRLTNDAPCLFTGRDPVVLGKGTISPINSQNTMVRKELFSLLYLPTSVTFRFTDILRGLVAQPILWLYDYRLGFLGATVVQKRNPHDFMKDFVSEIPMYEHSEKVIEIVSGSVSGRDAIETNLYKAYRALLKAHVVCDSEMKTLEAWLADMSEVMKRSGRK